MNITAKSRYALKIMMDLAANEESGHQQRHNIAMRQGISLDFMDQVTARLRSAGLVESIRGRSGGVQLGKPTTEISLWEIFIAVEDNLYPVKCLDHELCDLEDQCISVDAWNEVFSSFKQVLVRQSLHELVVKWKNKKKTSEPRFHPSQAHATCSRPRS